MVGFKLRIADTGRHCSTNGATSPVRLLSDLSLSSLAQPCNIFLLNRSNLKFVECKKMAKKEEEDNIGKPSAKIEFCRLINKQIMERKKKWPLNSGNCNWKLFLDLATPTSVADMEICATDCRQSTNTRSCRVQRPDEYIFTC